MRETAQAQPKTRNLRDALTEAGIAFLIALALSMSMLGFRADNVPEGLFITTHFLRAFLFAAGFAIVRLIVDLLVWRRRAEGETLESIFPGLGLLKKALLGGAFIAGGLLFVFSGTRTDLISAAADYYWLLGTLVDLLTFAAMGVFAVATAMLVAYLIRLPFQGKDDAGEQKEASLLGRLSEGVSQQVPAGLLIVALILPLLVTGSQQRYAMDTATQILIYVMLGWGLNVVIGLAGLLDLGYVAFYAVGAYSYALLSTTFGWTFWECLPVAGLLAALWGITLGFPVLRLRGDYLAIVTLAFGEIIRIVLQNFQSLTNGPNGINGIPRVNFFGLEFARSGDNTFHEFFGIEFSSVHRVIFFYYLILALALITNVITLRLRRLPIGRAWEALREDEIACRSLGINTVITKLTAFAIGAMFAGFAGSFFATRQGFISPESFTFQESVLVLAIVVLGGLGSQLGVVVAAVALIGLGERFRELQDYRMLIFGLAMVVIMIVRPRGLLSKRTPSASLKKLKSVSSEFVSEGRG